MTRHAMTAMASAAALAAVTVYAFAAGKPVTDAGARLLSVDGRSVGTILMHQTPQGVKMEISAGPLTSGVHAIHIHAVGKCEGAGFKSAGAHFDVGHHQHGRMDPKGPHTGDMDNVTANKMGFVRATVTDASITLGDGPNSVFDADGSSIVIHAGPDDYKTQPAGGSGDRVACGVIKPM